MAPFQNQRSLFFWSSYCYHSEWPWRRITKHKILLIFTHQDTSYFTEIQRKVYLNEYTLNYLFLRKINFTIPYYTCQHTKMMQSKYFKLLNRRPVNKIHWAMIILYGIVIGLLDSYYQTTNIYIAYGGLFLLNLLLNYYFLIYKEGK